MGLHSNRHKNTLIAGRLEDITCGKTDRPDDHATHRSNKKHRRTHWNKNLRCTKRFRINIQFKDTEQLRHQLDCSNFCLHEIWLAQHSADDATEIQRMS